MVPYTATCTDTFVNAVSKQLTLSQVAQLPHCRLQLDTASQWHNLHSACSPIHCTCNTSNPDESGSSCSCHTCCSKECPSTNACDMPCHTHAAMKIQPCPHGTKMPDPGNLRTIDLGLSMDLVLVMCCCLHPHSFIELNHCVSYSQKRGMLYDH